MRRLVTSLACFFCTLSSSWPTHAQEQRGAPAGAFDLYVLALSWSPGFCAIEGEAKGRDQCAPGANLGFVVHGLWPQFEQGFPTECGPSGRSPSRLAFSEAASLFPSEGLARYQWRKHGTCSGLSPSAYFASVRQARERVAIPDLFTTLTTPQTLSPIEIERAFSEKNPGLRSDMMSVVCRRDEFQEVRICFSSDLRGFRPCPDVNRRGCRTSQVRISAKR